MKIAKLSKENQEPLTEEDLTLGSGLLMDYKGKSYEVQVEGGKKRPREDNLMEVLNKAKVCCYTFHFYMKNYTLLLYRVNVQSLRNRGNWENVLQAWIVHLE